MLNAKPRFGFDEETGKLYDYARGLYIDAAGEVDGWDLALVAELIKIGVSIEVAFKGSPIAAASVVSAGVPDEDSDDQGPFPTDTNDGDAPHATE